MKIKSKNSKVASMKLCVPIDGIIEINANGIAEVSSKCAVSLVNGTSDWEFMKKSVDTPDEIEDDNNDEEEDEEETLSESEEFEEGLESMKLSDMKEMAVEAEYDESEWKKLTSKKLMKSYLIKKFNETEK